VTFEVLLKNDIFYFSEKEAGAGEGGEARRREKLANNIRTKLVERQTYRSSFSGSSKRVFLPRNLTLQRAVLHILHFLR